MYKALAIRLLYLYCEFAIHSLRHQRTTVALKLQRGISRNINMLLCRVFANQVTYYICNGTVDVA